MKIRKMTVTAFLVALAIIFHYIESFIPAIIPGFHLGLANVVSLFALFYLGWSYYVSILFLRVILVGLMFTGFGTTFMLSLGGAILSSSVSLLLFFFTKTSIYGVSAVSAFAHVLGQIVVYIWIVNTAYMLLYLPLLSALGIASGLVLAYLTAHIIKVLPNFDNMQEVRRRNRR
ncbi:MAG: Gx transporter family protein [Bacilli bacterium]